MFSYTFLVRAFIVGALVSICAAVLGVSLVLKRYSMIGSGLSNVGFGSLALATALHTAPLSVAIPVVILAAFLLLRLSENSKIKGDAAVALISTGSLAIGVIIISQTTGMNTDVCNYLFGSILAMSKTDVYLSVALSITVLVLFVLFYHNLFAVTFDETFARATGIKTNLYNMLIALLTALTIVLGMRIMGALLISSLIIFPALSSMRLFKKFKSVTLCSALVSILCFFIGVIISYVYATPTGASVVLINICVFVLFWIVETMRNSTMLNKKFTTEYTELHGGRKDFRTKTPRNSKLTVSQQTSVVIFLFTGYLMCASLCMTSCAKTKNKAELADVADVMEIKEKMFISQINDVYLNSEDYLGKTIKLEGIFMQDQGYDKTYSFVIRYGPGCCGTDGNAGFEVAWANEKEKPYPDIDSWVEATGVLKTYEEEDGYMPYLYLDLSSLNVLSKRGAEFVLQ
jgi:zinc transport system permease protein